MKAGKLVIRPWLSFQVFWNTERDIDILNFFSLIYDEKKIYNFWTKFRNSGQRASQKSNRVEHFSSPHPS